MADDKGRLWKSHAKPAESKMELSSVAPQSGDLVVETPPVVSTPAPRMLVEDAAYAMLEYLPEDVQELIREAHGACQLPMWQMLLGYVMKAADRSELFVPYRIAMWDGGRKANEARPCKTCGKVFTPARFPNQEMCCNSCAFSRLEDLGHNDWCPTRIQVEESV